MPSPDWPGEQKADDDGNLAACAPGRASGGTGAHVEDRQDVLWWPANDLDGPWIDTGAVLHLDAAGAVVDATPSARVVLGVRADDLIGSSIVDFVGEVDRRRVVAWLGDVDDEVADIAFAVLRRRGTFTPTMGIGVRAGADSTDAWLVRLHESSASGEEELAQARRTAEELTRRNQELAELIYAAGKDLHGPTDAVASALRGLTAELGDGASEDVSEMLTFMRAGLARMESTIDAVRACATAGTNLRFGRVNFDDLMAETLVGLQPGLDDAGAKVVVEDLGSAVGDREQLEVVLGHLVQNAVNHARGGLPVEITVTSVRGPGTNTISVSDDGAGLSDADHERAFQMFERLGTRAGSGMGLAVCRRIVEAHGGRIWLTGNDRGGTTACFTLPR